MAVADHIPQTFDGVDLTASPFRKVWLMVPNSPVAGSRIMTSIEADVIGLGPQDARAQPRAATYEIHCDLTGNTDALVLAFH